MQILSTLAALAIGAALSVSAADDVLPIDAANIDRLLKGYAAAAAVTQQIEARQTRYDECMEKVYQDSEYERLREIQNAAYSKTTDDVDAATKALDAYTAKKCGADPSNTNEEYAADDVAGAKAAAMTPRQYVVLRERLVAFLMLSNRERAENYAQYRFTGAERSVLTARRAELARALKREIE